MLTTTQYRPAAVLLNVVLQSSYNHTAWGTDDYDHLHQNMEKKLHVVVNSEYVLAITQQSWNEQAGVLSTT